MKNIKFIILGIVCSIICTIVLLLSFSIYLVNNNISENLISIFIVMFYMIAILFGAIITTKSIKEKGAIYGFLTAFIFIGALYVVSSFYIGNFSISIQSLYMIILGLVIGTIGGIIGVNIK